MSDDDFDFPLPPLGDIDTPEVRRVYRAVLGLTGAAASLKHLAGLLQDAQDNGQLELAAGLQSLLALTLDLFNEFADETQAEISVQIDEHADEILDGVDWDELLR
jgi:hypothetical protein